MNKLRRVCVFNQLIDYLFKSDLEIMITHSLSLLNSFNHIQFGDKIVKREIFSIFFIYEEFC